MRRFVSWLAVLVLCASNLCAADWPMWRFDASRSAASPDAITENPTLLWSRKLSPVRQAWPLEKDQRINFDAAYEPVVMGKLLFLGSPNDGSVTAYDTETGAEKWKFYTEGPVRCALACSNGKVFAGSDDGYLYCLDAQSGAVTWKFRGAPADRPDRRQLGNGHLISYWPVRSGPVVADGVVYFGAGIWPSMGVFLHALDAATGKAKWSNGELNCLAKTRIDHDYLNETGLSPQGNMVISGGKLIVPNGRSMPAGIDAATGKLIYYAQGWKKGDSRVAVSGAYAFVGKDGMISLSDFREAGSKWADRGAKPPQGYTRIEDYAHEDLFEAPGLRMYKAAEGCDAASAFSDGIGFGSANGTFYAWDIAHSKITEQDQVTNFSAGKAIKVPTWQATSVWQFKSPYVNQRSGVTIKAGNRIYGSAGKKVLALKIVDGKPLIAWEKEVESSPASLIAADGKLFVATAEGMLYCFGETNDPAAANKKYDNKPTVLASKADGWDEKVRAIVKASGAKAGYCVVLGVEDGRLIEELLLQTELHVLVVEANALKIRDLSRRFDAAALYGSRVEMFACAPLDFSFPPYLASLIVCGDAKIASLLEKFGAPEIFDVLHPYGGALCLNLPGESARKLESWAKGANAPNAVVKTSDGCSLLVREGALPGSAPWSHEAGDPGRTFCSQDDIVKAPLGFLWYGDENGFTQVHDYGSGVKAMVAGGRVFGTRRHSRSLEIFSYDAYTGRFLWKIERKSFMSHARMAALEDGFYLAADNNCYVYDPASGQVRDTFTFKTSGDTTVKDLRVDGDTILILCGVTKEEDTKLDQYWNWDFYAGKLLVCLDRKTGTELWRREAKETFYMGGLAVGGGRVFFTDAAPFPLQEARPKDWVGGSEAESPVFALDARTGKEIWEQKLKYKRPANWWAGFDWIAYSAESGMVFSGKNGTANGVDAKSGKLIWENKKLPHPPIVLGKVLLDWDGGRYDAATGNWTAPLKSNKNGCNVPIASKHLVAVRECSASYTDVDNNKRYYLRNLRSGCSNSLVPADGLLNSPNYSWGCDCNYAIQTSFAMVYMPEAAAWMGTPVPVAPPPEKAEGGKQ